MRNSSISCARTEFHPVGGGGLRRQRLLTAAAVVSLIVLWTSPAAALKKEAAAEELFNPLLGVEYSHWLVGPIYHMATDQEVAQFQALTNDDEASAFVAAFWERHNEGTELFKKTPEQIFAQRAETANSRYSEGTLPGLLTDRGTIYVLFGEPEDTEFESSRLLDGPPVENWKYPKKSSAGLNGETPTKEYRRGSSTASALSSKRANDSESGFVSDD